MLVGSMRVSSETDRQTTDLQHDALLAAGVDPRQLCTDQASGARDDRPGSSRPSPMSTPAIVSSSGNWTASVARSPISYRLSSPSSARAWRFVP